jgi:hypothetical protein
MDTLTRILRRRWVSQNINTAQMATTTNTPATA